MIRGLGNGHDATEEPVDLELPRALALIEGLSPLAVDGARKNPGHEAQVVIRRHLSDVQTL